jgi:hypothetical protein
MDLQSLEQQSAEVSVLPRPRCQSGATGKPRDYLLGQLQSCKRGGRISRPACARRARCQTLKTLACVAAPAGGHPYLDPAAPVPAPFTCTCSLHAYSAPP